MNFEINDINNSQTHLIALVEEGILSIDIDKIKEFVDFIIFNIDPDSLKENLLKTIQSFSVVEVKNLQDRFINENYFDEIIAKAFQLEKRRQLKQKLIQLDLETTEDSTDEIIAKAFQIEKRKELKLKLQTLERDLKIEETKVISIQSFLKVISIAASLILIFLVWQPQHSSDKKLFANYSSHLDSSSIWDFTNSDLIKEQTGLRGEEEYFRNYSYDETLQLLEAINLVKEKEFDKGKKIFTKLHVEKDKNPGLTLYLSIAQLNTGDLDKAITNLEYLNKLQSFLYQDDAKFHLAFAYLKENKRKRAKDLLKDLVNSKSKYSAQAKQTLKKIRWF